MFGTQTACAGAVFALFAALAVHAAPPFGCASPDLGGVVAPPFGSDPGLEHRCLASAKPDRENYYEDRSECGESSAPAWTIANHTDPNCGIGPDGQTFAVNDGVSPIRVRWLREPGAHGRDRLALRMKVDLETREHPCWQSPDSGFTWLTLQNNSAQSGAPLPRPDQLEQIVHLSFQEENASQLSHARMGVSAQLFWDGVAHLVEIDLYTSPYWGDAHPAADVIVSRPLQPSRADSGRYLLLDGRFLGSAALSIVPQQSREIRVRWHEVLADLIRRGLLPAPRPGEHGPDGWESTATGDVAVFTEVYKRTFSRLGGAVAAVTVRDFRVEARAPERGAYIGSVSSCGAGPGRLVVSGSGFEPGSLLQLFNRYHIAVGTPLEPSRRRGDHALLFDLDLPRLRQQPAFLRVLEPESGRASNFARTPFPQ